MAADTRLKCCALCQRWAGSIWSECPTTRAQRSGYVSSCGRARVATVSEVLRSVAHDFVVLAGAAGLGREVRRILLVRPPSGLTASFGRDDLVVYAMGRDHADSDAAERAVSALLGAGVAGVLSDLVPTLMAVQVANKRGSPLVASSSGVEPEHAYDMLVRALEQRQAEVGALQADLQVDFGRLSTAGGTSTMLLERLVEATGKTGVLQATGTEIEALRQPALQDLPTAVVRRAIHASDVTAQRWIARSTRSCRGCHGVRHG